MKNKPLLNESTVRKFLKLANLGRVGEGFLAENFSEVNEEEKKEEGKKEEEEDEGLAEDKHFGGTQGHKMKPAAKPSKKKVMQEVEDLEEAEEMVPADADAGAETPDMGDVPQVEPAEEPTEMDASSLADQIIQVLQGAGLVDVVEDEETDVEMGDEEEEEEGEEEEEMVVSEEEEEDEGMYEAKKRNLAKLVAERVQARLAREAHIDRLAESITKKVIARAKSGR